MPANAGPNVLNRPYSITADVEIPKGGAEGVLLSNGDVQGGFSFYVQEGKLHYVYNYVGSQFFHVESNVPVPEGRHKLRFEFEVTGKPDYQERQGRAGPRQALSSMASWSGRATFLSPCRSRSVLAAGIVCGADTGSPVWDKYQPPFKFTGTLYSATVDVSGELIRRSRSRDARCTGAAVGSLRYTRQGDAGT